jgi:hypothetical protein
MKRNRFSSLECGGLRPLLPRTENSPMGMLSQNVPHYRNVSKESLAWLAGLASLQSSRLNYSRNDSSL